MSNKNVLLIGLGYHAKRIYFPVLLELQTKRKIEKIFIVDLEKEKNKILEYLKEKKASNYNLYFLKKPENDKLSKKTIDELNRYSIGGVIISTEPLAHIVYAKWALKRNLSVLMDKPISSEENVAHDILKAKKLIEDFRELEELYEKAKIKNTKICFAIMAQRRFHNVFKALKRAIIEIKEETDCPITSYQSFHGDGQWRFPTEIIDQDYHPYNQGYGKCSHSGYHFFDIASWFLESSYQENKKPDTIETFSRACFPNDFLTQLNYKDYRRLFNDFDENNKYTEKEFLDKTKNFGEIDAFTNFTFKKKNRTITLASINLCHNGFSQRNWVSTNGRDLYKGNGRVRHENYYIAQGPFQSIVFNSYQSKEVDPNLQTDLYTVGGEYHLDAFVFRNNSLNPKWRCVEKYSVKDFVPVVMGDKSRGHQEDARREAIIRFIDNVLYGDTTIREFSDLSEEELSVKMMSGVYQSLITNRIIKQKVWR
jgi:predicted dehydrogenase